MRSLKVEMQSYREDNERMTKAQEEQNRLNASMLQSLTDIQRWMNSEHRAVNPEGSRRGATRRKRYSNGSPEGPIECNTLVLTLFALNVYDVYIVINHGVEL